MITINVATSRKTTRTYVQFRNNGYFYEIDLSDPDFKSENVRIHLLTVNDESELSKYSEDNLTVLCPENILTVVHKSNDKEHVYLRTGYNTYLPILRNEFDEFVKIPFMNQFEISHARDFLSILPPGVTNVVKADNVCYITKIHIYRVWKNFNIPNGCFLELEIAGLKSNKYYLDLEETNKLFEKIIDNHQFLFDLIVEKDVFNDNPESGTNDNKPIYYDMISNTLVGILMNRSYQIMQVEIMGLKEILPEELFVERNFD